MYAEKNVVLSISFLAITLANILEFIGLLEVLVIFIVLIFINAVFDIYIDSKPEQYTKKDYRKSELIQILDSMSNDMAKAEKTLKGKIYVIR